MTSFLVHDFAGHPFQAQLSRELARRGHEVVHAWCRGITSGQGDLARRDGDPATLSFVPLGDGSFERYSPLGRLKSEVRYGRALARAVQVFRPEVCLSANTPLVAQALGWEACRRVGARRVYWLQDFLGRGTRAVLAGRHPALGPTAGAAIEALERRLLRRSDGVIAITDDFVGPLAAIGARQVEVIENWAPLDEVAVGEKANRWAESAGLAGRRVALYAGTLGLKHDPEHLLATVRSMEGTDDVLVVMSEGIGREWLDRAVGPAGHPNLVLSDYVDYAVLPDVLATADVCLVLLEEEAGTFSVPSKVLTYLAAGRPIVAAMPSENLATRTVSTAGAGVVVVPGDHAGFAGAVASVLDDAAGREQMGARARAHAEERFDVVAIADRVVAVAT